jgi:hypothetical protein
MNLIEQTQAAHDDFVRAVQASVAPLPENAKEAIAAALEVFHVKARDVDAHIQSLKDVAAKQPRYLVAESDLILMPDDVKPGEIVPIQE